MEIIKSIQNRIYEIRGERIMLDFDLAELYDVATKVLNQALTMRSQNVTASQNKRNTDITPTLLLNRELPC
jgi:ORF6N domain